MTTVFYRNNLDYKERLSSVIPALFDFWQARDPGFPRGRTVLLKPNLLAPQPPDAAITTHPNLVEAIAGKLMALGNTVIIADSPAGTYNKNMKRLWRITGMEAVARRTGAQLMDLNHLPLSERRGNSRNFFMTDLLNRVDYVVNLPKFKTHGLTLMTGAIKNVFGLIPGIQKAEYHIRFPKPVAFADNMVDIFAAVRPHFTIMDGIRILEGDGPSSGGKPKMAGFLLAGRDAVAIDAVAAFLGKIDPQQVPTIRLAAEKGLGISELAQIDISGDRLQPFDLQIPRRHAFSQLPEAALRILSKFIWTRPRANPERCTHCGICIQNCPSSAMSPDKNGLPVIDYQTCINCFCCAEVCPEDAIFQETSWLVKKLT